MARITVEGTITPSTYLATGKRITVDDTAYVRKLIARGYIKIITEAVKPAEVVEEIEAITESQRETTDLEQQVRGAPALSALKTDWAAFLDAQTPPVTYAWNATRADMIDAWRAREAEGVEVSEPTDG